MSHEDPTDGRIESFDIVIVGAGVAGLNAAYRIRQTLPGVSFTVLERRDSLGGTWDQFRYPGVRSDSDVFTLGFQWHAFSSHRPIVNAEEFLGYLKSTVSAFRLDDHIRVRHEVEQTNWSSKFQSWILQVNNEGRKTQMTARWLISATGYFDHVRPAPVEIPGLQDFKGRVLHPQFWPKEYDHTNRKVALIGSGTTAFSIFPVVAEKAAKITMVQRSPSYVFAFPNTIWIPSFLPRRIVNQFWRLYFIFISQLLVLSCRIFPDKATRAVRKHVQERLPARIPHDPHFQPSYKPWTQRMVVDPDGVFLNSLHRSNTHIATGNIAKITENGIRMESGQEIQVDAIITATGFRMSFGESLNMSVDGQHSPWRQKFIWNRSMIDGIPNMTINISFTPYISPPIGPILLLTAANRATVFGYADTSWTLGTDLNALVFTRLWKHLESRGYRVATPRAPQGVIKSSSSLWRLTSTYSERAQNEMPIYGDLGNWKPRTKFSLDYFRAVWGNIESDLEFLR